MSKMVKINISRLGLHYGGAGKNYEAIDIAAETLPQIKDGLVKVSQIKGATASVSSEVDGGRMVFGRLSQREIVAYTKKPKKLLDEVEVRI